jgi:1-acyl-sn-glycerol-3-phosphate acyltransferase
MASKSGFSLWYEFNRYWIRSGMHTFYRRIEGKGYDKIPRKKPVIFTPNHQNAFLDAIVTPGYKGNINMNYLVRADVFKGKVAARIFASIKMMPIYRQRDGVDSLDKNKAIFEKCYRYLKYNQPILLFPEGNHGNRKTLRPLKKGVGRIAFGAAEQYDFSLDIHIIPTGINYSNYTDFGSTLFINLGDPIKLADYYEDYKENPAKTLNNLSADIAEQMSAVMIDIQVKEVYDLLEVLRVIYIPQQLEKENKSRRSLQEGFKVNKKLIEKVETRYQSNQEEVKALEEKVNTFSDKLEKHNFRSYLFEKENYSMGGLFLNSLLLVIGFPLFLVGFLIHVIPLQLPSNLVKKKIKDTHFHSSLKVGGAMVLFLLLYLTILIVTLIVVDPWWMSFCYLAGVVFSGIFALRYWRFFQKTKAKLRYNSFVKKKQSEAKQMQNLLQEIISSTDQIVNS